MLLKFTVWSVGLLSLITSANVIADTPPTRVMPSAPHTEFFQELASLCGKAFAGTRVVERPGRDLLVGNEQLRVHFDLSQEVDIPPAPWGYDELE